MTYNSKYVEMLLFGLLSGGPFSFQKQPYCNYWLLFVFLKNNYPIMTNPEPVNVIRAIRESFVGSVTVFTSGSCFQLYKILKTIYPDAYPLQDRGGHVVTDINGRTYDITGEVTGWFVPMDLEEVKRLVGHKYAMNIPAMLEIIDCGDYKVCRHADHFHNGDAQLWIENKEGEGTGVSVDKIFQSEY